MRLQYKIGVAASVQRCCTDAALPILPQRSSPSVHTLPADGVARSRHVDRFVNGNRDRTPTRRRQVKSAYELAQAGVGGLPTRGSTEEIPRGRLERQARAGEWPQNLVTLRGRASLDRGESMEQVGMARSQVRTEDERVLGRPRAHRDGEHHRSLTDLTKRAELSRRSRADPPGSQSERRTQ